jgi:hypothetical protein
MDVGVVEDEIERIAVKSTAGLGYDLLNVSDEHLSVDTFYVELFSLIRCINDRGKHFLSCAASDHVKPLGI